MLVDRTPLDLLLAVIGAVDLDILAAFFLLSLTGSFVEVKLKFSQLSCPQAAVLPMCAVHVEAIQCSLQILLMNESVSYSVTQGAGSVPGATQTGGDSVDLSDTRLTKLVATARHHEGFTRNEETYRTLGLEKLEIFWRVNEFALVTTRRSLSFASAGAVAGRWSAHSTCGRESGEALGCVDTSTSYYPLLSYPEALRHGGRVVDMADRHRRKAVRAWRDGRQWLLFSLSLYGLTGGIRCALVP